LSWGRLDSEVKTAKDILKYFLRHPAAADDLEGIARWRLLDEKVHQSLQETNQALEWLVEKGLLVAESHPVSGTLFRLNNQKRGEIENFLKSNCPESSGHS
jgi:hypothetical protein